MSLPTPPERDDFVYADTVAPAGSASFTLPPWRVLIVDDEPDVHEATRLALRDLVFDGRPLHFDHAHSAQEARALLIEHGSDIAVMLLDVVMEASDAGLLLVRVVRDVLGLSALRIILRTGQPGYAPELGTIRAYDINDYKSKGELTRTKLHTCVVAALRSYAQVRQLEAHRRGLEKIIDASNALGQARGLRGFSEGVVIQICALLDVPAEGLVCAHVQGDDPAHATIIAAAGDYAPLIQHQLHELPDESLRTLLAQCIHERRHLLSENESCFYFQPKQQFSIAVCCRAGRPLLPLDQNLLEAFSANIAVGFANVHLNEKVESLAFLDQLLQIPNRVSFTQHIDACLSHPEEQTLALIDIDDFANINATLDQQFGDRVLQAVAQRLTHHFSDQVTVGRVSSDCFGLLGPACDIHPDALPEIFGAPFLINGESLRLSVTSGFVDLNAAKSSGAELLKDAAIALKQAKTSHRGKAQVFSDELRRSAKDRMILLNNLRDAFSADRLFLVYQPQVDLYSRQIVGAEALLRWRTEDGSFIMPDRFIPLAEQSGIIVAIGEWVMRTACAELKRLIDAGYPQLRMAINVSHAQFREPGFVNMVAGILYQYDVPAHQVEIELTESVAVEDIDLVMEKLTALKALGVLLAIDDFGTGYSSLSILNQLPIDRIKIDRSFIIQMTATGEQNNKIVNLITGLGRQLNLVTIAEGVETEEQREQLLKIGCLEGQGYLFARPLLHQDLIAALQATPSPPPRLPLP
jgi:diguanylate cyclase (GGDEF)-like protein